MKLKRLVSLLMVICMFFSMLTISFSAHAAETLVEEISADTEIADTGAEVETADTGASIYGLADNVQDGQILQCWTWSYNNISDNLQKIAEQGFTAIQTSPIQPIKESTKEYYNTIMNSSWVVYQPVAFNIETNYRNVQGTKTEFEAMCKKAHKYGIKVIVDVVFNHMANDMSGNTLHPWIPSEIKDNSDCWHDISKNISNYDDRYDTTQHCLTGLPDLNTSNSIVQKHCTNFLKEAIDAGADGFRFDAVKHIETPSDASGIRSDFWPNVLGAATEYAQETRGFTPYYYGELLGSPGSGLSVDAYTQYMSVSDPGSSDSIRNGVCNGNASAAASGSISNGASKSKVVQWTESHDNHKDNGTADISEHNINKTWAIIGAKDEVCGLYLARPEDMNTTMMGDADWTSWSYPEVKAVNRFKNAFVGQSEYLSSYNKLACVERGTSGIVIVNTGGSYYDGVKVPVHKMASGTYEDVITGNTFTVSNGYISGDIGDTGIAVIYNADSNGAFTQGEVTDFAVAGTFNDWNTTSHKLTAIDANTASVTMFLEAGTHNFKLTANDLWYGNSGTINDTTGSAGWTVRTSVSDKCTLVATGGKYTFTFNITTGKLVIEHESDGVKTSDVYLKGSFNDWADTCQMTYVDSTNSVKTSVNLSAGTYTFKLHNTLMDSWYGNKGTINDTTGSSGWSMSPSESTKCTLVATGGTYTFTFDLSTQKLVVEAVLGDVDNTYTVTFVGYDGTILSTQQVKHGTAASEPEAPVIEGYTFKGWDVDFSSITADTTVTAVYTDSTTYLKGTFNNWDSTNPMTETEDADILTTTLTLEAGTYTFKIHSAEEWYGNSGTIEDTTVTTSSVGWSMKTGRGNCTLVATGGTYTFNFNTATNYLEIIHQAETYSVVFKDYNGTVLSTQTVEKGSSAKAPSNPAREGDAQYTYTFKGWDTDYSNITEDTVVTALYDQTVNNYTVTFKDYDGTELDAQSVEYGNSAEAPANPTREKDAQYSYAFRGWDVDFSNITEDTVVTALYDQTVNNYTVTFKDYDGTELDAQSVAYGNSAEAPAAPSRDGYKFIGWDKEFSNITEDTVVTATYSRIATEAKTGKLRIDITGGTGFKISVNGGALRPQGTLYMNTKVAVGAEVTVVANTVPGVDFIGWMNEGGAIVSKTDTFTFNTTGNDYFKAVYQTPVEGVNAVVFKNDKAAGGNGQILDMQYYASGDEIVFPAAPSQAGYNFTGWSFTAEEIQAKLAAGEDVTVLATWEVAKVYVDIVANGGKVTTTAQENGKYLAYFAVTVVADAAPSGQKFAYWVDAEGTILSYRETYKFFPVASMELTAVYVAEDEVVELTPILTVSGNPAAAPNEEKITYTLAWDIDASIGTVTGVGIIIVDKADYNEDTFKHGTTDTKVFDRAFAAQVKQSGEYAPTKTASTFDHTFVAAMWITYTDAVTGESVTVYSPIIEVYKPAP